MARHRAIGFALAALGVLAAARAGTSGAIHGTENVSTTSLDILIVNQSQAMYTIQPTDGAKLTLTSSGNGSQPMQYSGKPLPIRPGSTQTLSMSCQWFDGSPSCPGSWVLKDPKGGMVVIKLGQQNCPMIQLSRIPGTDGVDVSEAAANLVVPKDGLMQLVIHKESLSFIPPH